MNVIVDRLSVLVLYLALAGVMTAAKPSSCPADCPDVNTAHNGTHSRKPYCIAHPSLSCSAPKNFNCSPCELWRNIQSKGSCTFHYSRVHGSNNPEWIIEPCFAVSGIENILDSSQAANTNFLWEQAWGDAVTGAEHRTQIPGADLGLVMNSFYYRSMHQMHIHAAKLNATFARVCLGQLPTSFKTNWEASTDPQCKYKMMSKYTDKLSKVNSMIIAGAAKVSNDTKTTGALVSADPTGAVGYLVTVFEGKAHPGDHDILFYN